MMMCLFYNAVTCKSMSVSYVRHYLSAQDGPQVTRPIPILKLQCTQCTRRNCQSFKLFFLFHPVHHQVTLFFCLSLLINFIASLTLKWERFRRFSYETEKASHFLWLPLDSCCCFFMTWIIIPLTSFPKLTQMAQNYFCH